MENWEDGIEDHIGRLEDKIQKLTLQLAERDEELAKWAEGETYTAYGHEFVGGMWRSEPRGKNYSSHQRTVWMSAPTLIHHWGEKS